MKKIGLFGAIDRNNYGDLLFPIIFEKYYEKIYGRNKAEFEYYGLIESDMTEISGFKTESVQKAFNDEQLDSMIVVGGEVIGANWPTMYSHFFKNKYFIKMINSLVRINFNISNLLFKKIMGAKNKYPFLLKKEYFKNSKLKVIYNASGAVGLIPDKKELKNILDESDFFSARSKIPFENIKEIGFKKAKMTPDSAIIMSRIYSKSYLRELISPYLKNNSKEFDEKYYVFQIKNKLAQPKIDLIVEEIEKIYSQNKLKVILLPIGRAGNHDDDIALEEISKKLKVPHWIPKFNNIFDTMYILSNCQLYIGTSLHGAITAFSYGIRPVCLTTEIIKLIDFLETWGPYENNHVEIEELAIKFNEFYNYDKNKLKLISDNVMDRTEETFEEIFKIINGESELCI